jgi:hypothetical protein
MKRVWFKDILLAEGEGSDAELIEEAIERAFLIDLVDEKAANDAEAWPKVTLATLRANLIIEEV